MLKRLFILSVLLMLLAQAVAAGPPPVINEFVANQTGTDTHEFVEVFGPPDVTLSSLTILEIEGDGSPTGVVAGVFPVGTTDANGLWTTGFLNNMIENGTVLSSSSRSSPAHRGWTSTPTTTVCSTRRRTAPVAPLAFRTPAAHGSTSFVLSGFSCRPPIR